MNNKHIDDNAKNFKQSIKKLIQSLNKYKTLIIMSFILAALGSILSIISPNIVKNLTNEIANGIKVNEDNLELLNANILSDITRNPKYSYLLHDQNNLFKNIDNLNIDIKKEIFTDLTINNTKITNQDKITYINTIKDFDINNPDHIKSAIKNMPLSIQDIMKSNMNTIKIKNIIIILSIVYIVSALFNYLQGFLMAIVSNKYAKKLRKDISIKINKLPLIYFDKNTYGDILSRVTNDVDTINQTLHNSFSSFIGAVTLFIGSIIMMFISNYIMAITGIISSLFGFVFMSIIVKKSQKYFKDRQKYIGSLNGHIEEAYSNQTIIKAYNGEKDSLKTFEEYNNLVYDTSKKSQFLSNLMPPVMMFIGNFSYVCVCVVGAILVLNGYITFGVIVAFMLYIRLFTSPLSQIAQSMSQFQSTAAASERVFEFLDENEMNNEDLLTKKIKDIKGNIKFKNVKFGYDEKTIIKDFNCNVKSGQKIAIVGPTGAGKTTIVNLLMKFYEINSGDIIIDGISIKEMSRETIHDLFIMVLQDTWLFNGTIKDNVLFNSEKVSEKELWKVLEIVGVDHFVKSLPNSIDYEITDAESISAGQKQLLTIARGMIKNSPFLILDEATSSVDTRTEELVQIAMDKLTEGRTSFIIAHRLSTIKNADLILVMNDGDIIEQGNHKSLMSKKGFYANLYNSQFKK